MALTYTLRGLAITLKLAVPLSPTAWSFYHIVRVWMTPLGTAVAVAYLCIDVQLRQAVTFAREGCFPLPLRFCGKLEHALTFALVGYFFGAVGQVYALSTAHENLPNLVSCFLVVVVCWLEAFLGVTSAVASAVRYRDARLLLEYTSNRLERETTFVV